MKICDYPGRVLLMIAGKSRRQFNDADLIGLPIPVDRQRTQFQTGVIDSASGTKQTNSGTRESILEYTQAKFAVCWEKLIKNPHTSPFEN